MKYTLHRADDKTAVANYCEADSARELNYHDWCGKMTAYFVTDKEHEEYYLCKNHREQLRQLGHLK